MRPDTILALDPGTRETAWLAFCIATGKPLEWGYQPNLEILTRLAVQKPAFVVCEAITSYGMAVGAEVFETAYWIGEFRGICRGRLSFTLVPRLQVKVHHCHTAKAKDANIRQAMIDRFGEKGTKAAPGALYGLKSHCFSALAIGAWAADNLLKLEAAP